MVNGKSVLTEEFTISMKADIKEDFSAMTVEQLQQDPIIELSNSFTAGSVKEGKKFSAKFSIANLGLNPLQIRRIVCTDEHLSVVAPKSAIKSGKKADVAVYINALGLEPGNYSRTLTIISNDPKRSVFRLTLNWVVE